MSVNVHSKVRLYRLLMGGPGGMQIILKGKGIRELKDQIEWPEI